MPILCPFVKPNKFVECNFANNELKCGLHRSSIINVYYLNNPNPMSQGEYLNTEDVLSPPIIKLDYEFLSKFNTASFVLILLDPELMPHEASQIVLHWIRYFPSSLEDEEDICYYKLQYIGHRFTEHKIILLYATNSSLMMIKTKTICYQVMEPFQLSEYALFVKLKLIASTNFFLPFKNIADN